jgi:hypothetical protein
MHLSDILNDPGFGSMTTAAIRTHSLIMHIGVAIHTGSLSFSKNQGWMAGTAIHCLVLAG